MFHSTLWISVPFHSIWMPSKIKNSHLANNQFNWFRNHNNRSWNWFSLICCSSSSSKWYKYMPQKLEILSLLLAHSFSEHATKHFVCFSLKDILEICSCFSHMRSEWIGKKKTYAKINLRLFLKCETVTESEIRRNGKKNQNTFSTFRQFRNISCKNLEAHLCI